MLRRVIRALLEDYREYLVYEFGPERISINQAQRIFRFFHLSLSHDIKRLKPNNPGPDAVYLDSLADPIEDYTTKRVSFAPSIALAQKSLGKIRGHYVYAVDAKKDPSDDIETVNLTANFSSCPSSKDNPYGTDFEWDDYWAEHGQPPESKSLDKKKGKMLRGCVPDAKKTKEVWSTRQVKALRLGELEGDLILLSSEAKKYLKKIGVKVIS